MAIPKTLKDAQAAVSAAVGDEKQYAANRAYIEKHDHWQDGDQWVGPRGSKEIWPQIKSAIRRQFVAVDVLGEVLDRVANALLQREPEVAFAPLEPIEEGEDGFEEQEEAAKTLQEYVSAWWDGVGLWKKARVATKRSRWAGRGVLRLWTPPGRLEKGADGKLRAPSELDFPAALELIELSAPEPEAAAVLREPETQRPYGVFLYEEGGEPRAEVWSVDAESGETVLLVLGGEEDQEHRYQLGGLLPIVEMEAEPLITEPVTSQQNRLNFFESLLNRVGESAGFPERYTLNAQPHGIWSEAPPTEGPPLQEMEFRGKKYYLHAAPRTLGSAVTTELLGVSTKDRDGKQQMATPGVVFKEPTDPEYAIRSATHARGTILKSCKQGHLAGESTAEASGDAYEQARADFVADLDDTRSPLEAMLRSLISCVVAFAADLSGEANPLKRYRCVVNLFVQTGPITPEAKRENASQVEKALLSREGAMVRNGVEDVAAELQRIEAEPETQLGIIQKRATVISTLMAANPEMSMVQAAIAAGYEKKEALELFGEADAEAVRARQGREEIAAALQEGGTEPVAVPA